MLQRAVKYFTKHQRLNVATVGALLCHVLLFSGGFFVIDQFIIPSDTNRVLVLSLEKQTEDGEKSGEEIEANTINTDKLGEASSIISQALPIQKVAAPSFQPDDSQTHRPFEPNHEPTPEPPTEQPQKSKDQTTQAYAENPSPPMEKLSTADQTKSTELHEHAIAYDNTSKQNDDPFLSSSDSAIVISSVGSTGGPTEAEEKLEFSNTQQKMLNRKIRHWSENMENFSDSKEPIKWIHKGQTYVANFNRLPAAGDMDMDEVIVEIVTEQHGKELRKELRMKKLAFSNFAQFTHLWDDNVTIHDDVLDGRFHSNSTIHVSSDHQAAPIFNGKVTTASFQVNIDAIGAKGNKKNIFLGGLQTRVKKILMPKPNLIFNEKLDELSNQQLDQAPDNMLILDTDTQIEFHRNGQVSWRSIIEKGDSQETHTSYRWLGEDPFYVLAKSPAKLSVSGTINGKILVYSPKRVTIEGNLVYANRGSLSKGGDFLGIVSNRDVVIASEKITGPGDLRVEASIYAKGQFKVKNYRTRGDSTLHLFGSVSAMSMGATEPRFATNIVFDPRLEDARPPGFPVTNRYEVASIDQNWKEEGWLQRKSDETPGNTKTRITQ